MSRHIRDKICKADEKCLENDTCHETEGLSALSLLELPIITDISTPVNTLVQDNYMIIESLNQPIIEHGTELNLNETDEPKNEAASTSGEGDHPILWGCKQCDFRFVDTKRLFIFQSI